MWRATSSLHFAWRAAQVDSSNLFAWGATRSSHFAWRSAQVDSSNLFAWGATSSSHFAWRAAQRWLVKFICVGGDRLLTFCLVGCAKVARQIYLCGGRQTPRILIGGLRKGGSSNLFVWGATSSLHFAWRAAQRWLVKFVCVGGDRLFAFCLAGYAKVTR